MSDSQNNQRGRAKNQGMKSFFKFLLITSVLIFEFWEKTLCV